VIPQATQSGVMPQATRPITQQVMPQATQFGMMPQATQQVMPQARQQVMPQARQQVMPQTMQQVMPQATQPMMQSMAKQIATNPTPGQGGMLRQFGGAGTITTIATTTQAAAAPKVTIALETAQSLLTKLMPLWNGNITQVDSLVELRYINGAPIIDLKRRDVILEIIGMLRKQTFEEIMDFLTDAPNPDFVLWDQTSLDEGRIKVAREIIINQTEDTGVSGVSKCRYCPSTELVYAMKQLRSGDEPMTVFVRCIMCHKQWRQ